MDWIYLNFIIYYLCVRRGEYILHILVLGADGLPGTDPTHREDGEGAHRAGAQRSQGTLLQQLVGFVKFSSLQNNEFVNFIFLSRSIYFELLPNGGLKSEKEENQI